jgi:ribosomal protein L37AE/L43A
MATSVSDAEVGRWKRDTQDNILMLDQSSDWSAYIRTPSEENTNMLAREVVQLLERFINKYGNRPVRCEIAALYPEKNANYLCPRCPYPMDKKPIGEFGLCEFCAAELREGAK